MPETKTITFNHKEVAEALIKKADLHDGFYQIYVEFGLAAANIQTGPNQFSPAAIMPINTIGIIKTEKEAPLAVDASIVNPVVKTSKEKKLLKM